jgi:hypothetical protein
MSLGAQNMKIGPDAVGTAENGSGSRKHENWTPLLVTAENGSGSAKHENGTRHPRYRQK